MAVADELYLDNDYYIEVGPVVGLSLTDGSEVLMTGWVNFTAKICATDEWDAVALDASLSVTLTEEVVAMTGTGVYRGSFEGSNLSSVLDPYIDLIVYLHLVREQDYHVVSPVTVRRSRVVA